MKLIISILFFAPIIVFAQLKAFPTAEGYGKFATGGRGGDVYHVINLNNDGAGSLRYGIERQDNYYGPRTIVFDVGGDIKLTHMIRAGNRLDHTLNYQYDDLTIAGETAPFPGITITSLNTDSGDGGALINLQSKNIIVRYLTFRVNDNNASSLDALQIVNPFIDDYISENIIIDHLSISNGSDENFSIQGVNKTTIQNCMIGNGDNKGYNVLFGYKTYKVTFYRNLLHHSAARNPIVGYGQWSSSMEFINNLVFGYETTSFNISYGNYVDGVGNVFKAWNDDDPNLNSIRWARNSYNNPDGVPTDGAIYFADNFQENPEKHGLALYNSDAITYNQNSRVLTNSFILDWKKTISTIENDVLNSGLGVGNSLHRDNFDAVAVSDYTNGSNKRELDSFIVNKSPTARSASFDTDGDGMADSWELSEFGDLSQDNNGIYNASGNTNLEAYLFSLVGELADVVTQPINTYAEIKAIQSTFTGLN